MQKKEESNRDETEEIRAQMTTLQTSEKSKPQHQPNAAANLQSDVADNVVMDPEQPIDASNLPRPNRPVVAATAENRPPSNTASADGAAAPAGTHHSLSDIAAIADVQRRLIRLSESLPEDSTTVDPHSPEDFDINDIVPISSRVKREWHRNVLPALRKHLIKELVQTISCTTELSSILERHTYNMVCYSQKVESAFFEKAESMSRYFYLLAEKIYKLQNEFAGKQKKLEERIERIGELLQTGMVTIPGESVLSVRVNRQTHEQRLPDYRPQQQRPRQTGNLRVNPMQSPQRQRRPPPSLQLAPMPNQSQDVNLQVNSLLNPNQQEQLQQWYVNQRLLLNERQQMEQTVPSNSGWTDEYDDVDFSTVST